MFVSNHGSHTDIHTSRVVLSVWAALCQSVHLWAIFSRFVRLPTQFVSAWLWGCCFQVLQYCHSAVKGSVPSTPSCLAVLTQEDSPGNEYCNKPPPSSHFFAGASRWMTLRRLDRTWPCCQTGAHCPDTYCVCRVALCLSVYTLLTDQSEDIAAVLALFFIVVVVAPISPLTAPEMRVLLDN